MEDDYIVPQNERVRVFLCDTGTFRKKDVPIIAVHYVLMVSLFCSVTLSCIAVVFRAFAPSDTCTNLTPGFLVIIVWVLLGLWGSIFCCVPWRNFSYWLAESTPRAFATTLVPKLMFRSTEAEAMHIVPLGVFTTDVVRRLELCSGRRRVNESSHIMVRAYEASADDLMYTVETAFPYKWFHLSGEYRDPEQLTNIGTWQSFLPWSAFVYVNLTTWFKFLAVMVPAETYTCALSATGWHLFDIAALLCASTALFCTALGLVSTYRNQWLYCCCRRQRLSAFEGISAIHAGHAMAYDE